jgi:hypothetical protein
MVFGEEDHVQYARDPILAPNPISSRRELDLDTITPIY